MLRQPNEPTTDPEDGLPDDLKRVLNDGTVTIGKDAAVWELLYDPKTPSNTAPGDEE